MSSSPSICSGGPDTPGLVEEINDALFHDLAPDAAATTSFPLVVSVPYADAASRARIVDLVAAVDPAIGLDLQRLSVVDANFGASPAPPPAHESQFDLSCTDTNRECLEKIIYQLHAAHIPFRLDYSNFVSHPGILFIKKLSSTLVNPSDHNGYVLSKDDPAAPQNELYALLQESSHFNSLEEIKFFMDSGSFAGSQCAFAIVKFKVYLDVDIIIAKLNKLAPNPFNVNKNIPLYLNKYLNKKERVHNSPSASPASGAPSGAASASSNFDILVLENLHKFLSNDTVTIDHISKILYVIGSFGNEYDLVYFPLESGVHDESSPGLSILDYAFIRFKHGPHLMENTLRILYYLNGLTWEHLLGFELDAVQPLHLETPEESPKSKNGLKLTIAQYKHNHLIFRDSNNAFATFQSPKANSGPKRLVVSPPNPGLITGMSAKQVNYQETNIYVNNLPVLFGNNDELWETFWKQFGTIKSAKIINPQFYKNDDAAAEADADGKKTKPGFGKIGFVFYTDFKMAIRAILLTNNRLISVNGTSSTILIQSSFALQKSSSAPYAGHGNHHPSHRNWSKPKRGSVVNFPVPVVPIPAGAPQPGQFYSPYYFPFSPPSGYFPTSPNQQPPIAPFPHHMFGAPPPTFRRNSDEDYDSSAAPASGFYNSMGFPFTYPPPAYYYEQFEYEE